MNELMIKIDNVSKEYRLGAIGGGSLQGDLQSWWARKRGKEDPNIKIGAKTYGKNERFLALDGVSFDVKKGERVGIIGHNGAGKSTLLKLLSRVTAPSAGEIGLNGRVASMLEVGTGFHGELTGRENIYMNGAILGMTRAEIDTKMDDIIDFSECRQFIDTPVKRYSSGMYVKLAFSVAAHLDSEIMIMDEVLAVGDMAFQKKCLDKMNDVSRAQGRTILYVSHNMNTIRQLCDRVVVLDHGKVVFDGDVDTGIDIYLHRDLEADGLVDYTSYKRPRWLSEKRIRVQEIRPEGEELSFKFEHFEPFILKYVINSEKEMNYVGIRIEYLDKNQQPIASSNTYGMTLKKGKNIIKLKYDIDMLAVGTYYCRFVIFTFVGSGQNFMEDCIPGFEINIVETKSNKERMTWVPKSFGCIMLPEGLRI